MDVDVELRTLKYRLRDRIDRAFMDIERRLELGIYATDQDVTREELLTRLQDLQEHATTMSEFVEIDSLVNELIKRGQFAK